MNYCSYLKRTDKDFFSFFLIDSVSVHFMFAAYKYSGRKN